MLLKEKVSDGGTLYAAVNAKIIAQALTKKGFKVEENMVELNEPIKEITQQDVVINLPHGFEATVRVIVEAK